jgi:hypothetical protein
MSMMPEVHHHILSCDRRPGIGAVAHPHCERSQLNMPTWNVNFLDPDESLQLDRPHALIVLNQPFTFPLLQRLWKSTDWRCCADGGGNRLYDLFSIDEDRLK